jgi:hypothetical protein
MWVTLRALLYSGGFLSGGNFAQEDIGQLFHINCPNWVASSGYRPGTVLIPSTKSHLSPDVKAGKKPASGASTSEMGTGVGCLSALG